MWKWIVAESAIEQLKKMDGKTKSQILVKIDYFVSSGKPLSFAKKMINWDPGLYRFRAGDYRVIFEVIDKETIKVLTVGHRREVYK